MKNSISTTSFIAFCFLMVNNLFSQENFQPGYVINLSGDTVKGYIDYRNWDLNPNVITFKSGRETKSIDYIPTDIIKFFTGNEIYESAIVDVDDASNDIPELKYKKELKYRTDTTFLQTLINGEKSLYYYKEKSGKENFFIRLNSKFELLVYKRYLVDLKEGDSWNTNSINNRKYIGQLSFYLKGCPQLQSKINTALYTKGSLTNLFESYYNCSKDKIGFQKSKEGSIVEYGAVAGITLTKLKFSGDDSFAYLSKADFPQSKNLALGLYLNIVFPRSFRKWSFYNELLFTSYKVKGEYVAYKYSGTAFIHTSTLGFSYLKLNSMLRYKYPLDNMFLFVYAGFSNGMAVSETNILSIANTLYNPPRVSEGKAISSPRKYEFGFTAGIGSQYKNYSLEFRYEKGNGISSVVILDSPTSRLHFLMGYRF